MLGRQPVIPDFASITCIPSRAILTSKKSVNFPLSQSSKPLHHPVHPSDAYSARPLNHPFNRTSYQNNQHHQQQFNKYDHAELNLTKHREPFAFHPRPPGVENAVNQSVSIPARPVSSANPSACLATFAYTSNQNPYHHRPPLLSSTVSSGLVASFTPHSDRSNGQMQRPVWSPSFVNFLPSAVAHAAIAPTIGI